MKLIHKHSIINLKYRIRHEMFGFDTEIKYQITIIPKMCHVLDMKLLFRDYSLIFFHILSPKVTSEIFKQT